MLTKEQALTAHEFHAGCTKTVGPRGDVRCKPYILRRNGETQTWKTRPANWRIPVKRGMYEFGSITQDDADLFVIRAECPVCGDVNGAETQS
jgi:hypothetical protein